MPLFKKPLKENAYALVAKCEICNDPAMFGTGVNLMTKQGGKWWCGWVDGEAFCKKDRLL